MVKKQKWLLLLLGTKTYSLHHWKNSYFIYSNIKIKKMLWLTGLGTIWQNCFN